MRPVQREVLRDKVAFADEVVLLELGRPEVDLDGAQDQPHALAALGAGGVVDHVRRDEIINVDLTAGLLTAEQFLDDGPRASVSHVGGKLPREQQLRRLADDKVDRARAP